MTSLTRRVLLAGAALLPASLSVRAATVNDDSKLFDLAAEWWRFENAVNSGKFTVEEIDDLTDRQDPIARAVAATPAHTPRGFSAKLRVYDRYSTASMESEWTEDRVLASVLQDAERLAGGTS